MPVNKFISCEYRTKTKNGDDYTANASDFAVNLIGNAMKPVQASINVAVDWYAVADAIDTWNVKATTIERTTGNFFDDGFYAGQKFAFISAWSVDNTTPIDFEATIGSISSDGVLMTFTVTTGAPVVALADDDVGIRAIGNAVENKLTGVLYRYGFIENDEPFNTVSKIAEIDNRYQAPDVGIGGSTVPVNMIAQGTVLTWQTGTATAEFVSDSQFQQNYKIVHEFILNPWFLQGQEVDIADLIPPEYFKGNRCLKHAFEIEFRQSLSNPNQTILAKQSDRLGLSGWFDENFNGIDSDYELQSIVYTDTATADVVATLQPDYNTTVVIIAKRLSGNYTAGTITGFFVSFLASQQRYQNPSSGTAVDAFLYDSIYHVEGSGVLASSGIIKTINSTATADLLTITVTVEYTPAQSQIIDSGGYLLSLDLANQALSNQNSDSVSLIADLADYMSFRSIEGLLSFTKFNVLTHNEVAGIEIGQTALTAWNEDGLLIDFAFDLDLSKSSVLTQLLFRLVAYNTVTDESFDLDSYNMNLSGVVISSGVQQIEVATIRGYILANGDQFNYVQLTTGAKVGSVQSYSGFFAQKIKWQDWLSNINADAVFYDSASPNNNLNFKSSNYSNLNNYQIRIEADASLTGVENGISGTGAETGTTGNLTINNYSIAVDGWVGTVSLHDPDTDADTGFVILGGKDTVFRVTWQNVSKGNNLINLYAIHRIQQNGSAGNDIWELSSITEPPINTILLPMTGETLLKVTQQPVDFVITECLIDKDRINQNSTYNLSFKISRSL